MLIVYAAISAIIWIKTLFLSSYKLARVNIDQSYSVFADSPVGRLFRVDQTAETVSYGKIYYRYSDHDNSNFEFSHCIVCNNVNDTLPFHNAELPKLKMSHQQTNVICQYPIAP